MKAKELHLVIVSPETTLYNGVVSDVTFPGSLGEFMVLPQHAPLLSSLKAGSIRYTSKDGTQSLKISSGFVEIKNNEVSVCVEQ